jgi:mRNA interferase RelE/StbE
LAWIINYTSAASKQLKKLDKSVALRLIDFMDQRVASAEDPRTLGKSLKGPKLGEYWRYRVGEYRIICNIQDGQVCILVIEIGNRQDIYK